jgi:hypothetical protein
MPWEAPVTIAVLDFAATSSSLCDPVLFDNGAQIVAGDVVEVPSRSVLSTPTKIEAPPPGEARCI